MLGFFMPVTSAEVKHFSFGRHDEIVVQQPYDQLSTSAP